MKNHIQRYDNLTLQFAEGNEKDRCLRFRQQMFLSFHDDKF